MDYINLYERVRINYHADSDAGLGPLDSSQLDQVDGSRRTIHRQNYVQTVYRMVRDNISLCFPFAFYARERSCCGSPGESSRNLYPLAAALNLRNKT